MPPGGASPFDPLSGTTPPPEVLKGAMQAADTVGRTLDSFAQLFPQHAGAFSLIKEQLTTIFADVLRAGAPALSPTEAGSPFPGTISPSRGVGM